MEIGYFGLSANPVHLGHKAVVEQSLKNLDEVWVCPAYTHPFNKNMENYEHRLEMTKRTFQGMKNVKVLEIDMLVIFQTGQKPFTYNILNYCHQNFGIKPKFIIGEDNMKEDVWSKFYEHEKIQKEFGVVVVSDLGVHSTQIREMVLKQQWEKVKEHCVPSVVEYIKEKQLYLK